MKIIIKTAGAILLSLLMVGCLDKKENSSKESFSYKNTLFFNEEEKTDYIILNYSEVFSEVEIIPLEQTENSLIASVDQVLYTKEGIIIRDRNTILFFDTEGNFIRQIGRTGKGPGEFIQVKEVNIDEESKKIYVLDRVRNQITEFDTKGQLIDIAKISMPKLVDIASFHPLSDGFLIRLTPYRGAKSPIFMKLDREGKPLKRFFDNQAVFSSVGYSPGSFFKSGSSVILFTTYMDEIYEYKENIISPKFKINSSTGINPEAQSDLEWRIGIRGERGANGLPLRMDKFKYMHGLQGYWETDKYIGFQYIVKDNAIIGVIYDKEKKEIFRGFLKDDILEDLAYVSFQSTSRNVIMKKTLLGSSEEKIKQLQALIKANPSFVKGEKTKQRIAELTLESNPVIAVYKAKKSEIVQF